MVRWYVVTYQSRQPGEALWRGPLTCPVKASDPDDAVSRFRGIFREAFGDTLECQVIGCQLREAVTAHG